MTTKRKTKAEKAAARRARAAAPRCQGLWPDIDGWAADCRSRGTWLVGPPGEQRVLLCGRHKAQWVDLNVRKAPLAGR